MLPQCPPLEMSNSEHTECSLAIKCKELMEKIQVSWDTVNYPSTTLFCLKARVKPVTDNSSLGKPILCDTEMDWEVQGVNCCPCGEAPATSHVCHGSHPTTAAMARFTVPQLSRTIPTPHPAATFSAHSSWPNHYRHRLRVICLGRRGTG